jgi:hypothetical protein
MWSEIGTAVGGALGGGILVLLGQWFSGWRRRPRIVIEIGTTAPYLVDTHYIRQTFATDGMIFTQPGTARYVRVLVRNDGLSTALDCRVFLTNLEMNPTPDTRKAIIDSEPIPLPWSFDGDGSATVLNISRKFARLCDVVAASALIDGGIAFQMKPMPAYVPSQMGQGRYTATITVTGDNFDPVEKKISVELRGTEHFDLSLR